MNPKELDALAAGLFTTFPPEPLPLASEEVKTASAIRLKQWQEDCIAIANVCEKHNKRFNRLKFLFACKGVK